MGHTRARGRRSRSREDAQHEVDVPATQQPSGVVVGAADDPFEREAHRVADALLAGRPAAVTRDSGSAAVGRVTDSATADPGNLRDSFDAGAGFRDGLSQLGAGSPLPGSLRTRFSTSLGIGLDHVRVHTGGRADQLNRSIGARAFTLGSDIVVGTGDYRPGTPGGDRLLAHEVAHVAQQAGRSSTHVRTVRRYLYQEIVDQFGVGDLMYGLAMARSETQAPVKAKMRLLDATGGDKQQAASVLDELNNYFVGTSGYNTDDPSTYGSDYGTTRPGYHPDPAVQKQAARFRAWLEADQEFGPIFTGITRVRGKAVTDKHRTWERIKQVCMAGLKYTTSSGKKIYFILDYINLNDVVQELNWEKMDGRVEDPTKRVHDPTGDAKEDITPNELRFLYEHWHEAAYKDNVTFWRRGKQVEAPWKEQPKLWQRYADKLSNAADDAPRQKDDPALPQTKQTRLDAIRTDVLAKFGAKDFVFGSKAAMRLGVTLEETTGLSRGGLVKKIMGLKKLDRLRQQAKDLDPASDPATLSAEIARIGAAAATAADSGGSTKYLGARLAMAGKVAFYLWRRVPAADVDKGAVYQAQTGVTGQSRRSASPQAVLIMGPSAVARGEALTTVGKNLGRYVHAEASRFASMLPSVQERGQADDSDLQRGAVIANQAAHRAIDKNRNVVLEGVGDDVEEFGPILDKLHGLDYRVQLVLGTDTIDPADVAACQRLEKVARNFQTLHSMANAAFIVLKGNIEWRTGMGLSPYAKIREKMGSAQLGEVPKTTSEDPNYEVAATRFEERLGTYAFTHKVANDTAKALADKVDDYMNRRGRLHQQYVDAGKDASSLVPDDAWRAMGEVNVRIAGAVGNEVLTVQNALRTGNLRERLTALYNFCNSVLGKDVLDGSKAADIKRIMRKAKLNRSKISKRAAAMGGKGKLAEAIPDDSTVNIRDKTRKRAGVPARSTRRAKEAPGLSDAEKKLQGITSDDDVLQWNEGVKAWLVQERDEWAKVHLSLGIPVAAGPSGHTNSFMQMGEYLNVNDPDGVRLAVIGHLLPIRAHSLVEILEAAKPYGATAYSPGRGMYRTLAPLTLKELTDNVAENGKFPDELVRKLV